MNKHGYGFQDLTGQRFGRWLVVSFDTIKSTRTYWNCVCDCGKTKSVSALNMRQGKSTSCGCMHVERMTKHGYAARMSDPAIRRTYNTYDAMMGRMNDPKDHSYEHYKSRGITIEDPRWQESITYFIADMGLRPVGTTLDRVDNNKGYYKENCRWATPSEQCTNKSSSRVTPEMFGQITREIAKGFKSPHCSRMFGVSKATVIRIREGRLDYCTRPEYLAAI